MMEATQRDSEGTMISLPWGIVMTKKKEGITNAETWFRYCSKVDWRSRGLLGSILCVQHWYSDHRSFAYRCGFRGYPKLALLFRMSGLCQVACVHMRQMSCSHWSWMESGYCREHWEAR